MCGKAVVNILVFEQAKGGQKCKRMGPMSRFGVAKPHVSARTQKAARSPKVPLPYCKSAAHTARAGESINCKERARQHIFDKDGASEKKD
jgi:hypothetical protein